MKKTMALFTIAGLSMASEFDAADSELHLYKLQNGITALVHTVDDELRVLPIDYHPHSSNGPRVILADDELMRALPMDHSNRQLPKPRPVFSDDELMRALPMDHSNRQLPKPRPVFSDDELVRALPMDHSNRQLPKPRPIFSDDNDDELMRALPLDYLRDDIHRPRRFFAEDDELRVLPIGYHPGSQRPHVVYADDDDEFRVLPIDYHPGSQRPQIIRADDDDEFRVLPIDYHPPRQTRPNKPIQADDDEFRVIPSAYPHAVSKYGKKDKKPVPEEIAQNDDELRLVDIGPGGLLHKKSTIETPKLAKLNADDADSELHLYKLQNGITALVHTVDDELRVLPIDYHPPRQTRPNKPIQADDDELRLVGVGPGSLTHKKNTTETAKPIEVKPKRSITGADKLNRNISSSAADDEMRFAHFIPQYRPKKEDVEKNAADNTLLELSELLVESQGGNRGGFLRKGR